MGKSKLISKSAALLEQKGFEQSTSVSDEIDHKGTIHTVFKKQHTPHRYHARAKAYVYNGLASFGSDMVEKALEHQEVFNGEVWLLIYFDDIESFFVFDPKWVEDEGTRSVNNSKRSEAREWIDVPLDDGVTLDHFREGERPREGDYDPHADTIDAALWMYGDDE